MPGLDLLRAIAIVWVMLFHSFIVGGLNEDYTWLSRFGWMGVDLFFVLSGFLIGSQVLLPISRGQLFSFRDFYIRRAFRILPAFWIVLMLYFVFPWFREAPGMEPWWKFAGFFMNLSIDYVHNQAFSHAWSLCIEEHFYLIFPLLAWSLSRRMSAGGFIALIIVLVLAGIALRTGVWLHDTEAVANRNWFIEDIYYPTWNRLDGLLAGVALAALKTYRSTVWDRLATYANRVLLAGLVVVAIAIWLFRNRTGLMGNAIGWPVLSFGLALLVFAGAQTSSWIGRYEVPGAAWLAAVSYSLYLIHKPIYHIVAMKFGETLSSNGLLAFTSYGAAALFCAALLYYLVERPGLQLRDHLFLRASRMTGSVQPAS